MNNIEKVLLTGALCGGGYLLYAFYAEKKAAAAIKKEGVNMQYDVSQRSWAVIANTVDVEGKVVSRLVMVPGSPDVIPSATEIQAFLTKPSAEASMEF